MTSHDWGYSAEIVPRRSVRYPRGKVTGGSSAVNATIALRGAPDDCGEWAAWGNDAWSWANVLPSFCRLEDDPDGNPAFHGIGGPLPIRRQPPAELSAAQLALLDAYRTLGFPTIADHNDPATTGAGPEPHNQRDGLRVSTAIAYLLPARRRPNLTIRGDTLVDRVIFDGARAVGLEVECDGARETLSGWRITLSAGAIGSPAILLRSGIGPAEDLRRLGISPLVDSPGVGANLIDHPFIDFRLQANEPPTDASPPLRGIILRCTAPGSTVRNDLQVRVGSLPARARCFAALMRPNSRGTLRLTERGMRAAPAIRLNLAADPEDRRRLREALRLLGKIIRTPLFAPLEARTALLDDGRTLPAEEALAALAAPEASDAYIQQTVQHYVHPVGTARMGPDGDVGAVVDQHCRVRGVENLRVVDASVMPNIPRANTNLTCIMIGERVAGWLRAE